MMLNPILIVFGLVTKVIHAEHDSMLWQNISVVYAERTLLKLIDLEKLAHADHFTFLYS